MELLNSLLSPSQWLSPQWLWLFTALAVPLLIHLLRRSQYREITFAAAHWLQRQPRQNWKRLQLRDKWLLLLRLLLIALLVLLVARPVINEKISEKVSASNSLLLVDPQVSRAEVTEFLAQHGDFEQLFWLQPDPQPFDQTRPATVALWPTLSLLASEAQFRRAQILLASAQNPTGHRALRISPHWQWHALNSDAVASSVKQPRIALLGDAPVWFSPAVQEWIESGRLQTKPLNFNALEDAPETVDSAAPDWLIYAAEGELPKPLKEFVASGGLLLTDQRVLGPHEFAFSPLKEDSQLEAAALGRGSWLRYKLDWRDPGFYQNADFARRVWQQWSAQDWALQAQERAYWSIDNPPAIPVLDTEIPNRTRRVLDTQLLLAFLLLLSLERLIALSGLVWLGGRSD